MPLGDTYPTTTLPGRRMDGKGWETWLNPNQTPTIPADPSTYSLPGTLGQNVRPGPYETWTAGAAGGGRGGGGLTAPQNPVPSLNQIIAETTQQRPVTKGLGVESLLQNQVLGRILNSYYGDQAWLDLANPYVDVAATPEFKTYEGGGGAYGYIDPVWGRVLPSLNTPEMQDIELEEVAGGKRRTERTPRTEEEKQEDREERQERRDRDKDRSKRGGKT